MVFYHKMVSPQNGDTRGGPSPFSGASVWKYCKASPFWKIFAKLQSKEPFFKQILDKLVYAFQPFL